ncbi:MAG: hypothetical protein PHX18_05470 [Candidatus Gastranaerophilales bacterium]|nr:hypothetical protein [Candidatus Gastranaerophilales bacterium]
MRLGLGGEKVKRLRVHRRLFAAHRLTHLLLWVLSLYSLAIRKLEAQLSYVAIERFRLTKPCPSASLFRLHTLLTHFSACAIIESKIAIAICFNVDCFATQRRWYYACYKACSSQAFRSASAYAIAPVGIEPILTCNPQARGSIILRRRRKVSPYKALPFGKPFQASHTAYAKKKSFNFETHIYLAYYIFFKIKVLDWFDLIVF